MNFYIKNYNKINLIVLIPFITILFHFNYVPSNDEIFQLEAALRLFNGQGYTASNVDHYLNTTNQFKYLHSWPIGYSALICFMMYFGISLIYSIKLLKFIIILSSYISWVKFSKKILKRTIDKILYSFLLILFLIVNASSITDTILIFILSLIFNHFYSYFHDNNLKSFKTSFFLGILCSIAFLFKYNSIGLIIPTFLFFTYLLKFKKKESINNIIYFILIVSFTVFIVFYTNYLNTSELNTITKFVNPNFYQNIKNISYYLIIKNTFLEATLFPIVLTKSINHYFKISTSDIFSLIFILLLVYKIIKDSLIISNKFIFLIVLFFSLSNLFFLYIISISFYRNMNNWLPVYEVRYYSFTGIFLILFYITKFEFKFIKIILTLVTIILIFGFTKNKYDIWKDITNNEVIISKVISDLKLKHKEKIFEIYTDDYYKNKIIRNGIDFYYSIKQFNQNKNKNNLKIILLSDTSYFNSTEISLLEDNLIANRYSLIYISHSTKFYYNN